MAKIKRIWKNNDKFTEKNISPLDEGEGVGGNFSSEMNPSIMTEIIFIMYFFTSSKSQKYAIPFL